MQKTHIFCGKEIWFSGFLRQDCVVIFEHQAGSQ